jgi:hypothetical protein
VTQVTQPIRPTRVRQRREVTTYDFTTPEPASNVVLPDCAQNSCSEYLTAGIYCATQSYPTLNPESYYTSLQSCWCGHLIFPTACSPVCTASSDLADVASWYWALCPSQMDSRIGQIALATLTVPDWAIPTSAGTSTWTTGLDCYSSSVCSKSYQTPTALSSTSSSQPPSNTQKFLPAIIIVPIAVLALLLILYFFLTRERTPRPPTPPPPPTPPDRLLGPFNNPGVRRLTSANITEMSKEIADLAISIGTRPNPNSARRFEELEGYLSCPVCTRLYHNPVSLVSSVGNSEEMCCKLSYIDINEPTNQIRDRP